MTAIPVSSDDQMNNPRTPTSLDRLDALERRLTVLERAGLNTLLDRIAALEEAVF